MTIIRQSSFRAREAVASFSRGSREEPLLASGCGYKASGWICNGGARSNRAREAMGTRPTFSRPAQPFAVASALENGPDNLQKRRRSH